MGIGWLYIPVYCGVVELGLPSHFLTHICSSFPLINSPFSNFIFFLFINVIVEGWYLVGVTCIKKKYRERVYALMALVWNCVKLKVY